jgi:hypothetical protein
MFFPSPFQNIIFSLEFHARKAIYVPLMWPQNKWQPFKIIKSLQSLQRNIGGILGHRTTNYNEDMYKECISYLEHVLKYVKH